MKNLFKKSGWLTVGAICLGFSFSAGAAQVIFSNTGVNQGAYYTENNPNLQYGNRIGFALPSTLSSFSFDYYGGFTSGNPLVSVTLRLYLPDGAEVVTGNPLTARPGTLLFQSTFSPLTDTTANPSKMMSLTFDATDLANGIQNAQLNNPLSSLIWTVQFGGISAQDVAGLPLAGWVPEAGFIDDAAWMKDGANDWATYISTDPNGLHYTFSATVEGTPVPEPSAMALSVLGGLALFSMLRRSRRG